MGIERQRHLQSPEFLAEHSGRVNERFLFGRVRVDSQDYQRDVRSLREREHAKGKPVALSAAVELIKRYQPFEPDRNVPQDPTNPVKQFPRHLRERVARALRLDKDNIKRLRFWTAVDSLVDTEFKADAVLELESQTERGQARYVRLDTTLREKMNEPLADTFDRVLIGQVPDAYEEPAAYEKFLDVATNNVVRKFGVPIEVEQK